MNEFIGYEPKEGEVIQQDDSSETLQKKDVPAYAPQSPNTRAKRPKDIGRRDALKFVAAAAAAAAGEVLPRVAGKALEKSDKPMPENRGFRKEERPPSEETNKKLKESLSAALEQTFRNFRENRVPKEVWPYKLTDIVQEGLIGYARVCSRNSTVKNDINKILEGLRTGMVVGPVVEAAANAVNNPKKILRRGLVAIPAAYILAIGGVVKSKFWDEDKKYKQETEKSARDAAAMLLSVSERDAPGVARQISDSKPGWDEVLSCLHRLKPVLEKEAGINNPIHQYAVAFDLARERKAAQVGEPGPRRS